MRSILIGLFVMLFVTIIIYLASAFYFGSFNLLLMQQGDRIIVSTIWAIFAIFITGGTLFSYIED